MPRTIVTPGPALARWAAVGIPLATAAALSLAREDVTTSTAAVVLVLTVVACSATGDRIAGPLSAVVAGLSFDVFLTAPYGSLAIEDPDDVEVAIALVLVGLAVTGLARWGRHHAADALRRGGYIAGLAQLVDLPDDQPVEVRATVIAAAVTEVLGADRTTWVGSPPRADDAVVSRSGSVIQGAAHLVVERDGLPTGACTALPVVLAGRVVGHFSVVAATRTIRPDPEQLRVAMLLADRMSPRPEASRPRP